MLEPPEPENCKTELDLKAQQKKFCFANIYHTENVPGNSTLSAKNDINELNVLYEINETN